MKIYINIYTGGEGRNHAITFKNCLKQATNRTFFP